MFLVISGHKMSFVDSSIRITDMSQKLPASYNSGKTCYFEWISWGVNFSFHIFAEADPFLCMLIATHT
jgi:hypothetical protein